MSEVKQMSQVAAVIDAVRDVLRASGQEYAEGTNYLPIIVGELRAAVVKVVEEEILSGMVRYSKKFDATNEKDVALIHKYTVGMVLNHLRKSPALNGQPRKVRPAKAAKPAKPETQLIAGEVLPVQEKSTVIRLPKKSPKKSK